MKDFFKMFFASILGVFTAGIILACVLFFVMIGIVTSMASSVMSTEYKEIKSNSIMKVDITSLPEIASQDPLSAITGSEKSITLSQAIEAINMAKNNPKIKGIYINSEMPMVGMASLEEVRRALVDFKKSGKFIYAYADNYTQKGYYLSSVADKIYLNPQGKVNLFGIASENLFYKRALDKLGVEMLTFKVGTYKGAVEPYILDHMSDANREQIQIYIDGLWDHMVNTIADSRKIPADSLKQFADRGDAMNASAVFVNNKLVDSLAYREDLYSVLKNKTDIKQSEKLRLVSMMDVLQDKNSDKKDGDKIAVVYAEGAIMPQGAGSVVYGGGISESLVKDLMKLAEDDDIKAVVMRVTSPGGSAFLSEQIWHQVEHVKSKKPIVVSMGDYAASGGYYISCAANRIFAEATTLTGSIGIFGQIPNAKVLADKIGINVDVVKTSKFADLVMGGNTGGLIKPMSDDEKALIQGEIERGYDTFITRVAEGRKMTKEQVDSVGQGRVWLGAKAATIGLVDEIGGMDAAIKYAAQLANVKKYKLVYKKPEGSSLLDLIWSKATNDDLELRMAKKFLTQEELDMIKNFREARQVGIMARLPYGFSGY